MKLALPVISLVFLVIAGRVVRLRGRGVVGVIVLAIAVGLLSALFVSERFARRIGDWFGRVLVL